MGGTAIFQILEGSIWNPKTLNLGGSSLGMNDNPKFLQLWWDDYLEYVCVKNGLYPIQILSKKLRAIYVLAM